MNARICAECGERVPGAPEPDPCLGRIPGVSHACCGHGSLNNAYVVVGGESNQCCTEIEEFLVLRGWDALKFFELAAEAPRCKGEQIASQMVAMP